MYWVDLTCRYLAEIPLYWRKSAQIQQKTAYLYCFWVIEKDFNLLVTCCMQAINCPDSVWQICFTSQPQLIIRFCLNPTYNPTYNLYVDCMLIIFSHLQTFLPQILYFILNLPAVYAIISLYPADTIVIPETGTRHGQTGKHRCFLKIRSVRSAGMHHKLWT